MPDAYGCLWMPIFPNVSFPQSSPGFSRKTCKKSVNRGFVTEKRTHDLNIVPFCQ